MRLLTYSALIMATLCSSFATAETVKFIAKPAKFSINATGSADKAANISLANQGMIVSKSKPLFGDIVSFELETDDAQGILNKLKRSGQFSDIEIDIRIQSNDPDPIRALHAAWGGSIPDDPYFPDQLSYFGVPGETYEGVTRLTGHSILPIMQQTQDLPPARVAIIDGGFARVDDINWADEHLDFVDNDNDPFLDLETFPECENSHGIGVAGAAAAIVNNGLKTAGSVSNATVYAVRALDCGGGYLSDAAYAIAALAGEKIEISEGDPEAQIAPLVTPVDVINMSFSAVVDSGIACPFYLEDAIEIASSKNILMFAAAGNDSSELGFEEGLKVSYPGMCGDVVNVGATGTNDDLANFSNYGDIDLAFRGDYVAAPAIFDHEAMIGYWEGTSFSSPLITGVGAMMKQVYPDLGYADFMGAVELGAKSYPVDGQCVTQGNVCGAGFIDVESLFDALVFLQGQVILSPVLDDNASCKNEFLTNYLNLGYPVCQHFALNIGDFAFNNGGSVNVYRVEKGIDIETLVMEEHVFQSLSSEDGKMMQVEGDLYDYYYDLCSDEAVCSGNYTLIEVEQQASSCAQ